MNKAKDSRLSTHEASKRLLYYVLPRGWQQAQWAKNADYARTHDWRKVTLQRRHLKAVFGYVPSIAELMRVAHYWGGRWEWKGNEGGFMNMTVYAARASVPRVEIIMADWTFMGVLAAGLLDGAAVPSEFKHEITGSQIDGTPDTAKR